MQAGLSFRKDFPIPRLYIDRVRSLMMSDFRGDGGGSEMTPKNWTLEGKNQTLKGDMGSFMDDTLCKTVTQTLE